MEPLTSLSAIFVIAFLGSLGHCVGMCGGFVVAYSSAKIDFQTSKKKVIFYHFLYNIGRVIAYTLLGALFGALGSVFITLPELHGSLLLSAGVAMILTGLSLTGKIRFLLSIEKNLSTFSWLNKSFSFLVKSRNPSSFLGLGVLNGFFPCGFVYFFAVSAAATTSLTQGALVMATFGLATIPVLFALGSSVSLLKNLAPFRRTMTTLASLSIILYGLVTIYYGLAYFFDIPL